MTEFFQHSMGLMHEAGITAAYERGMTYWTGHLAVRSEAQTEENSSQTRDLSEQCAIALRAELPLLACSMQPPNDSWTILGLMRVNDETGRLLPGSLTWMAAVKRAKVLPYSAHERLDNNQATILLNQIDSMRQHALIPLGYQRLS